MGAAGTYGVRFRDLICADHVLPSAVGAAHVHRLRVCQSQRRAHVELMLEIALVLCRGGHCLDGIEKSQPT